MKKTVTAILVGILLIGTLRIIAVSAVASNDTKATGSTVASNDIKENDNLGQMHNLCGKYMNSGTMHTGSIHNLCGKYMGSGTMHNLCGKYMNYGTLNTNNSNESIEQKYTSSSNNQGGFSCH
jgi:hypothetical protein